jgi:HK97 family phage portal protein
MGIIDWTKNVFSRQSKSDPSYAVATQFFSPGQPVWSDKTYQAFTREGYRRNGTVYNCINKISGVASGIKWKLYTDETMTREIKSHDLLTLWKKPNAKHGTGSFVEQVFGFWHISGNSYIYANRINPNEAPVELWALRPDRTKIVVGEKDINGYVYGYGTSVVQDFDVTEVLHIKFPAYDNDFYGLSPIEVASNLIDQQNEGNAWNTALMQNAGKPASVFFAKGYLTTEQRSQMKEELRRRYSGKRNSGMPLLLEGDMTWQQMSMSPYELDWLESRELNTRDIASIFDVAPELVGDSAGKTFANQKEAKVSLYTDNVIPKMDRFRDHLNAWLVPMFPDLKQKGAYFTYDTNDIEILQELYQAKRQALIDQTVSLWENGLLLQCDAQEQLALPINKSGRVYRLGGILVPEDDIEKYAEQALTMPAAPPPALAEPLNLPPAQIVDSAPPTKKPQNGTPEDQQEDDQAGKTRYRKSSQDANYKVWNCAPGACDFCMQNDGVTVGINDTFPNGCSTPDDCHDFCKCEASTLYIPDGVDLSHVAEWGYVTLAAAFAVAHIASRHAADVAAQREKDKEKEQQNAHPSNNRNGNAPHSNTGKSLYGNQKAVVQHTGTMVALFLDPKAAKQLAIPDGEDPDDLHITLAYLKSEDNPNLNIPALKKLLISYASEATPLEGTTSGVGRFSPSEQSDGLSPVWAAVNISGLQDWRADLVKQLEAANITIASNFDYQPHITLDYIDSDAPMPINDIPTLDLSFNELWLCVGDDRYSFPIGDEQYASEKSNINAILNDIQDYLSKMSEKEIEELYEAKSTQTERGLYQYTTEQARIPQRYEDIQSQEEENDQSTETRVGTSEAETKRVVSSRDAYREFIGRYT